MCFIDGTLGTNISSTDMLAIEQEVARRSGLDYYKVEAVLGRHGNAPGCHPPLLLALTELILKKNIRRCLEFGSGVTTYFLSTLLNKVGGQLVTLEQYQKWYELNQRVMDELGIPPLNYILTGESLITAVDRIPNLEFDLVLVDSASGRAEATESFRSYYHRDAVILWDDCQEDRYYKPVVDLATKLGWSKPKRWFSESRGIATIDPVNKIDFIKFLP